MRNLVIILGDQLNRDSSALDGFDARQDAIWMAEVPEESEKVWSSKPRIALFLSAMRHFRDALRSEGLQVFYRQMDESASGRQTLAAALEGFVRQHQPEALILTHPGEYQILQDMRSSARALGVPLQVRPDGHFLSSPEDFNQWASGRKSLRMEYFYREMRRSLNILMDGACPVGGSWNYDAENRKSFAKSGPSDIPVPIAFPPDSTTQEVLQLVNRRFASHPGSLEHFDWPVTPAQANLALEDFIRNRLPCFGEFQDAMWPDEPWLYHSRLSSSLNLKLLDPRKVIRAAEQAYRAGHAPLTSVEGFIRQILGWREYVRGVYWLKMPAYIHLNALEATQPLPDFYWTGKTDMECMRQTIAQTLEYGYAHHIQRLMVTGLFALLLGVHPAEVHKWYLAVYVDAVEWVELPNTLGMSQFADGGIMASKPYAASGKYIDRMSGYCKGCRYSPANATGPDACPFTTLYWDFLGRNGDRLSSNARMVNQLRNLRSMEPGKLLEIKQDAKRLKAAINPEQ